MLRSRRTRREEPLDAVHVPEPIVTASAVPTRARGAGGRLSGPRPASGARDAEPGRAARVRAPRHLCGALRRDRADRRPLPEAARQLASRARRRVRAENTIPDADPDAQRDVVDAFLAAARDGDFDRLVAVLDPDVVLRADLGAAGSREVRGAAAVIGQAMFYAQLGLVMKPCAHQRRGGSGDRAGRPALLAGSVHSTRRKNRRDGLARRPRPRARARSDDPRRLTAEVPVTRASDRGSSHQMQSIRPRSSRPADEPRGKEPKP